MSGEIEAAADVATAGLVGRTLEPGTGARAPDAETTCRNCGAALVGAYCHQCGQKGHVHRSLAALGHDLVHGILHLDGKIWRTLPLLAWQPGKLTRRYIHGERASFLSPLALFLFSVFLMFAVFSAIGRPFEVHYDPAASLALAAELRTEQAAADRQIQALTAERDRAIAAGKPAAAIEERLDDARKERAMLNTVGAITNQAGIRLSGLKIETGWAAFDAGFSKAVEDPKLLLYKLQSNGYKFSWLLIPISLPFMGLMFLTRRDYGLYDHAVFITYSIAAISILLVILALLTAIGMPGDWTLLALVLLIPIHLYRQLRGAYRLGSGAAAVRTFWLLLSAIIALQIFLVLLLILGVLG